MVYEGYSFVRCSNTGNVNSNNSDAGGFIGDASGTSADNSFIDCCTSASVSGYDISGGFIGSAYSDFSIKNCYKTGYIESNNSMYNKPYDGAVVGHLECYATIDNLYYTLNGWYEEDLVGEYAVGEHIDESTCYYIYGDQFASGEVAYKLNGNTSDGELAWGQTIGTEYYPVLGGKTVYYGTNCAFDFFTEYLANCDLPGDLTQLSDTQAEELLTYKSSYTANESYAGSASYYGSSLVLKSRTEIKHYFAYDSSKTSIDNFTCTDSDSNSYEMAESGSYLYAKVDNIPAHRLGETLTLSLYENGEKVGEISYSPLSCAYSVLSAYPTDDGTHDNVRNLVKSLYQYNLKAVAYKTR